MQIKIALMGELRRFAEAKASQVRRGAMRGAKRFQARAKLAFRQDTRAALGERAANTWRDNVYPLGKLESWHPATVIWSKWPAVIRAHEEGATIRGKNGNWLAIPTENTPHKGKRFATPWEVELMFNQDLITYKGRGGQVLAFVNVISAKSGRGYRRATKRRTKDGRETQMVLMFVMVRQVTLRPRLNYRRLTQELIPVWIEYLGEEIARELGK